MINTLEALFERRPDLKPCEKDMTSLRDAMVETYKSGGKILVCGNGGSCADADHIVGELMKGFLSLRPLTDTEKQAIYNAFPEEGEYLSDNLQRGIPAINLCAQAAISSAFVNDVAPDMVYAQMVFGYAKQNDLFIGLSTSGNSKNVVNAAKIAKAKGIKTAALTGMKDSKLSEICDITIKAPETETYKIQECHLPIYHWLCASAEEIIF